jgi:hypothetical protein
MIPCIRSLPGKQQQVLNAVKSITGLGNNHGLEDNN